jgi:hypothetical protein
MRPSTSFLVAGMLTGVACSGTGSQEGADANAAFLFASDAGTDGSADAGADTSGNMDAAGISGDDAGSPDVDAGAPGMDAGPSPADAGVLLDAGSVPVDAGSPSTADAGPDLGDSVPNSAPVCTSGVYWLLGNLGTDVMNPGQACITCHATNNGPTFTAAGTVYPTTHEPNNCDGQVSGWTLVITDAAGNRISLTPNLAGNFDTKTPIVFPYTVQLSANGQTREMLTPQSTGDCNSCHTQDGANGAPGRIVAP